MLERPRKTEQVLRSYKQSRHRPEYVSDTSLDRHYSIDIREKMVTSPHNAQIHAKLSALLRWATEGLKL